MIDPPKRPRKPRACATCRETITRPPYYTIPTDTREITVCSSCYDRTDGDTVTLRVWALLRVR